MQDADLVDMSFGTGAVKITPAHDPNDFKTGERHNLPRVNVFDDNGSINANGGPFEGQQRFVARRTIVEFLEVCFYGDMAKFMVERAFTR
jgi:valyl-tRNA synthetase